MYDLAGGFMRAWGLVQANSSFPPSWSWEWQVGYSSEVLWKSPPGSSSCWTHSLTKPIRLHSLEESCDHGLTYWWGTVCPDAGSPTLQTTQPFVMRPWWFWTNSSSDHPSLIFSFSICMMGPLPMSLFAATATPVKERCHVKWCWKILVYSKSSMNIHKAVEST